MNATHDTDQTEETPLDPRSAAYLMQQTRQQARRQFEPQKPLTMLVQAAAVFGVYGAIWLSVLGQHPYRGPSLGVIGLVYLVVVVGAVLAGLSRQRATAGISGPSRQQDQITAAAVAIPWIAVYVFIGALHADGFSNAIVYGVIDAAAPWLVVGAVLTGLGAAREKWDLFGTGIGLVVVGTASVFAGPIGVWAVLAFAGGAGLLAKAITQTILLRRA